MQAQSQCTNHLTEPLVSCVLVAVVLLNSSFLDYYKLIKYTPKTICVDEALQNAVISRFHMTLRFHYRKFF